MRHMMKTVMVLELNGEVLSEHESMDDALDAMYAHIGFDKEEGVYQKGSYRIRVKHVRAYKEG